MRSLIVILAVLAAGFVLPASADAGGVVVRGFGRGPVVRGANVNVFRGPVHRGANVNVFRGGFVPQRHVNVNVFGGYGYGAAAFAPSYGYSSSVFIQAAPIPVTCPVTGQVLFYSY